MENISFTSRIKFIPPKMFYKEVRTMPQNQYVGYPWTVKQSVISDSAYTTDIIDCSVCGITDGQKVFMLHICPTREENFDFSKIENFIKEKVDLTSKNIQALLLGSKNYGYMMSEKSWNLFENFEKLLQKFQIPYSKFRGGPEAHNVAYRGKHDEWIISNIDDCLRTKQTPEGTKVDIEKEFEEVKISPLDEICIDLIQ
ncbi:MAG: hypothetical protein E7Z87_02375 [Cyanobacteria bacterium SIG26]|nr:hypothetical protein [Cyanobacteria bacterium SIG26]